MSEKPLIDLEDPKPVKQLDDAVVESYLENRMLLALDELAALASTITEKEKRALGITMTEYSTLRQNDCLLLYVSIVRWSFCIDVVRFLEKFSMFERQHGLVSEKSYMKLFGSVGWCTFDLFLKTLREYGVGRSLYDDIYDEFDNSRFRTHFSILKRLSSNKHADNLRDTYFALQFSLTKIACLDSKQKSVRIDTSDFIRLLAQNTRL